MRVSQNLLRLMDESIDRGWFDVADVSGIIGGREKTLSTLIEGYVLGLFNYRGETVFELRREGLELLNIWGFLGRPEADPWIDTRIYSMLRILLMRPGGIPEDWIGLLEERGLATGDELSQYAAELLSLMDRLEKTIFMTTDFAGLFTTFPDGPAERVRFSGGWELAEAMSLLVASIPNGLYLGLTEAGRTLKRALRNLAIPGGIPVVVNRRILEGLERLEAGEKIQDDLLQLLISLDYVSGLGRLEYRGRMVLKAYRMVRSPPVNRPMAMTAEEEQLLRGVVITWRERMEKTNVYATKERIAKNMGVEWTGDLGLSLKHLESLGLVEEYYGDGKEEYRPTKEGEELSGLPGLGEGTSVEAVSSVAKTVSALSPSEEWVSEALSTGILGGQGPTKKGEMLYRAGYYARRPFLTRDEAVALRQMPERKSVDKSYLVSKGVDEKGINRLVTRGLIELLPDGRYVITDVGLLLKTALVAASPGIATPVYPTLVKVLEAIDTLNTDDPVEIIKATKLSVDAVKTALIIGRNAKYIGRSGKELTQAGKALLQAAKLLAG